MLDAAGKGHIWSDEVTNEGQMDMSALYTRRNKGGLMGLVVMRFQGGLIDGISQPLTQLRAQMQSNGANIGCTIKKVPEQELESQKRRGQGARW